MRAYLPLKRSSNIANPVAITRNQPASPRRSSIMPKNRFCLRNTEYYGIRISDNGYRISVLTRMSDAGNRPAPVYSARVALPPGCRVFLFPGCGIATEFGYWIYRISVGYRRYPDVGFSRPSFMPHGTLAPLLWRAGGLARLRAGGMRKLERMLFLRVPKGTADLHTTFQSPEIFWGYKMGYT